MGFFVVFCLLVILFCSAPHKVFYREPRYVQQVTTEILGMSKTTEPYDVFAVLREEVRRLRLAKQASRRKRFRPSQLLQLRVELVAMRRHGATLKELQVWLKTQRINVHRSTIHRFLSKLPELQVESRAKL